MRLLIILALAGFWPVATLADGHAQVEAASTSPLDELRAMKEAQDEARTTAADAVPPGLSAEFTLSPEVEQKMTEYALAYYGNLLVGLDHRQRVFEWQYMSSIIIFFVVITIVLIGLYFSWMQFHAKDGDVGQTNVDVSKDGIKVSSPVLGVIILLLSLAFFYLYLVHVYPISELR